jgi:hypothetical protein
LKKLILKKNTNIFKDKLTATLDGNALGRTGAVGHCRRQQGADQDEHFEQH